MHKMTPHVITLLFKGYMFHLQHVFYKNVLLLRNSQTELNMDIRARYS